MSARPENEFPTLRDFRDRLSELVEKGLGDLPAQVLVVPDSSMQALARYIDAEHTAAAKPALMIELDDGDNGRRAPVSMITVDRTTSRGMPSRKTQ